MFLSLFQPRYVNEAHLLAKNARKLLHRKKDLLSDATVADLHAEIGRLEDTAKRGDEVGVKEISDRLDTLFSKFAPHRADAAWRENCEVLLVAFVIAIGIRAYFLQPFKIPTGSMQPTLNGIIGHPVNKDQPLPSFLVRTFDSICRGRSYVDAVSETEDRVIGLEPVKKYLFMDYTQIRCASGKAYTVHAPVTTLVNPEGFGVHLGVYHAGDPIARGYVETGDQVFVDKFSYHFRRPHRGDVFVFNTRNIKGIPINEPEVTSQFYIKRLAGISGDTLRIEQPHLFIDGELAKEFGFQRVMSLKDGYRGYSNYASFLYLHSPVDELQVPPKSYFALGDNSFNSLDSRAWGRVPAENVVGRGLFVYWPFSKHWGSIR